MHKLHLDPLDSLFCFLSSYFCFQLRSLFRQVGLLSRMQHEPSRSYFYSSLCLVVTLFFSPICLVVTLSMSSGYSPLFRFCSMSSCHTSLFSSPCLVVTLPISPLYVLWSLSPFLLSMSSGHFPPFSRGHARLFFFLCLVAATRPFIPL